MWGTATQAIDANGNVSITYANSAPLQAQSDAQSAAGDAGSSPGVTQSDNMFGKASKIMLDLLKRVAPESGKKGKDLTKQLNQSDIANKLN
jgi:hypothetical protein